MSRVNLLVPTDILQRTKKLAEDNGVTLSHVIREGMEMRLEMPEFRESVEQKIASYRKSLTSLEDKYARIIESLKNKNGEDMFEE